MKVTGFDKLGKQLKKMQQAAQELQGTQNVPFDELFTPSFMQKYTDFSSFDELLEKGGFVVNSQEDFEKIPDDVFDEHISKNTKFSTWGDMLDNATENYVAKKLGF